MATYAISRSTADDSYGFWRFDSSAPEILTAVPLAPGVSMPRSQKLMQVGGYLIAWGPAQGGSSDDLTQYSYPFRVLAFDAGSNDPLNATPLLSGSWPITNFYPYPISGEMADPGSYTLPPNPQDLLQLIPFTNFVMSFVPMPGRGTYALWNFDPFFNVKPPLKPVAPDGKPFTDPIQVDYIPHNGFQTLGPGDELHPIGTYCLVRNAQGALSLWSFDPQSDTPLPYPPVEATLPEVAPGDRLAVIGSHLLAWSPGDLSYRLWRFSGGDPVPFGDPVRSGTLNGSLDAGTTLTGFCPLIPPVRVAGPAGTMDFMRSKVKHVVHYMLESRSFDNVMAWLYETGNDAIHYVGSDEPYQAATTSNVNVGPDGKTYSFRKWVNPPGQEGKLMAPEVDLVHGYADSLMQMFDGDTEAYQARKTPNMGGYVKSTMNPQVMQGLTPDQLTILNGLARSFGVSDEWFCSIPAGTDVNRAFALTGSAQNQLYTYELGTPYEIFPLSPRRPSYFKLLWSYGITDWKMYWSMCWQKFVFTYHLYLKGQINSLDSVVSNNGTDWITKIDNFITDAQSGNLPRFSYLEPIWFVLPTGVGTNSYHPSTDLIPGEIQLNKIYQALSQGEGSQWEDTLFFITFSKNGGTYDHVSPPYAQKPWPHDGVDGFYYDLMGPRVPALVVSPWIKENTVFRSGTSLPFDSTSFGATLLEWFGIPRSQWRLGDRMAKAPTFEAALNSDVPLSAPTFPDPTRYPGATNPTVPTDCEPLG